MDDVAGDTGDQDQAEGVRARLRAAAAAFRQRAQAGADPGRADPVPPPDYHDAAAPRDPAGPQVPRPLQQAAAWAWRLLLVGLLIYVAFRLASTLRLVVLPCIAALLLTALLQPLTSRLRKTGMPALAATWCTVLAVIVVLGGLLTLAVNRISADYPTLVTEVRHTAREVQSSLAGPPFHLSSPRLQQLANQFADFLSRHQSQVAGAALTGGRIFLEILGGLVLMLFVTFFLLKDGDRIWAWLISGLAPDTRRRVGNAGNAAWAALMNYVRGTTAVAAIHAIFIGLALLILGVPLLVPLVILVFLAAYVPLIGILVVGALAILVTLGTKGWLAAVILLAVFIGENQIESHLLQPLVVGRIVRLHPLAIILVLAVGGIIAGIAGAIVAVPAAAALSYAWPHLRRDRVRPPPAPGPPGAGEHAAGAPAAGQPPALETAPDPAAGERERPAPGSGQPASMLTPSGQQHR
ncbi:MAG TPA: AI-2E family transporter [Streptosporangiaceae bacterium]